MHCKVEKVSMFHCFNDFMSNTDEILETNNEQMKVEQLHISPWAMQVVTSSTDTSVKAVKLIKSMSRLKS